MSPSTSFVVLLFIAYVICFSLAMSVAPTGHSHPTPTVTITKTVTP